MPSFAQLTPKAISGEKYTPLADLFVHLRQRKKGYIAQLCAPFLVPRAGMHFVAEQKSCAIRIYLFLAMA